MGETFLIDHIRCEPIIFILTTPMYLQWTDLLVGNYWPKLLTSL